MAQIDKLLAHITPRGGIGLSLEPDQPPMLQLADGRRQALLANPVPGTMIDMLAQEIVPAHLGEAWTTRGEAAFDHGAGDESFRLVLGRTPLGARIQATPLGRAGTATAPGLTAPLALAVPAEPRPHPPPRPSRTGPRRTHPGQGPA